jgi:3-hydroxy-3-methylglutaryl CoA synthase
VSVRLSHTASGVAVEERSFFNDSTDAAVLAAEVAHHITSSASGRSDLEAIITVSDGV